MGGTATHPPYHSTRSVSGLWGSNWLLWLELLTYTSGGSCIPASALHWGRHHRSSAAVGIFIQSVWVIYETRSDRCAQNKNWHSNRIRSMKISLRNPVQIQSINIWYRWKQGYKHWDKTGLWECRHVRQLGCDHLSANWALHGPCCTYGYVPLHTRLCRNLNDVPNPQVIILQSSSRQWVK